MRYAYAETTPSLNLAASLAAQIRGGWAEVGTTIAEHPAEHTHTGGSRLSQPSLMQQPFGCTFRQKPSRTRLHGQEAV